MALRPVVSDEEPEHAAIAMAKSTVPIVGSSERIGIGEG